MRTNKTFSIPEQCLKLFPQPERVQHLFKELIENQLSGFEFLELWPTIKLYFQESCEPEQLLIHFSRISNRVFNPATFYKQLIQFDHFRIILFKILETSEYLTDILSRHPEYFYWLSTTGINLEYNSTDDYYDELSSIASRTGDQNKFAELLKSFKRREILRIGVRDFLDHGDFNRTVTELSILADAILQVSLNYFLALFESKFGRPDSGFFIIALGKLGGNELNYSSDVDLIFVYDKESEVKSESGLKTGHNEYFNTLAENLTNFLVKIDQGENIYRVDTRLRPDGDAGALARSRSSMIRYYETRGKFWERQMLIKARPVAGDLKTGQNFLADLTPFIFPKTFFHSPKDEISRIKAEIEQKISEKGEQDINIKLKTGGIRDIEFIIQAIQQINGGNRPEIRDGTTLSALERSAEYGLITNTEFKSLKQSYIFLRTVEHFLQLASGKQTHLLPEKPVRQTRLANHFGFANWQNFIAELNKIQKQVRDIYDKFFALSEGDSETQLYTDFISGTVSEKIIEQLKKFGFQNPGQIFINIQSIFAGISPPALQQHRQLYNNFIRELLLKSSELPEPDQVITRIIQLIHSFGSQENFLKLLSQQQVFLDFILDLCSKAPVFVRMLNLDKKYYSLLFNPADLSRLIHKKRSPKNFITDLQGESPGDYLTQITKIKNQAWLTIGLLFIKGKLSSTKTWGALTDLADWILTILFILICKNEGLELKNTGIFALGKMGGRELNFGSDLDILCLYAAESEAQNSIRERLTQILQQVGQMSAKISPLGYLYYLDFRLRPEGESSPLVLSDNEYFTYFKKRAQLWEKQAMLKIRFVAGDKHFGQSFQQKIKQQMYDHSVFDRNTIDEIVSMKSKMETKKSRFSNKTNIKTSKGGIVDIEFLSQTGGLFYPDRLNYQTPLATISGLEILHKKAILSDIEFKFVKSFYFYLRDIESYLTLALEKSKPEIPTEKTGQNLLAYCFTRENTELWLEQLHQDMKKMHGLFIEAVNRVG